MGNGTVLFSKDLILGMSLVLIALVVRLIGLSLDSLWFDEVFSVRTAALCLRDIVSLTAHDVHPPLYYLLLHFWTKLFGETESAVRMLSVAFSVLSVFVIFRLALELFNRRIAFFAALLTTLSPLQVFYAQETRMYAQLTCLSTISVYFFLRWLKDGARVSSALYIISTTMLLYTHLYAVFIVMAQVLYFAFLFFLARETFQKHLGGWLRMNFITILLFLPWMMIAFQQAARAKANFWIKAPDWLMPFQTLIEYCGSLWLTLLLLPLFIYGVKRRTEQSGSVEMASLPHLRSFLLLWLILPISLPFLLSKLITPFYLTKYTLAASLPFYLFAAVGLSQVRRLVWQAVLGVLVCVCCGLALSNDLTRQKRERWRDAAYNVERAAESGDLVLFNSAGSYLSFTHYAKRKDIRTTVFPYSGTEEQSPNELTLLRRVAAEAFGSIHPPKTEQEASDILRKTVGDHRRIWIVTRYGEGFKNDLMRVFGDAFRATTLPALCVRQVRFLFSETFSETDSAIYLERRGLSCSPQVYLLER